MYVVICPHCKLYIEIQEINCAIFRHGVLKLSGEQINPHAPKAVCDQLVETNAIYGCGKPFKLVKDTSDQWVGIECDYI
jgi:hypothetical protein